MKLDVENYRYNGEKKLDLGSISTSFDEQIEKKESKNIIEDTIDWLKEYQEKLFASEKRSVLVIFQAMDAAGKDSTLRRLVSGINPQGIQVHGFKKPSTTERLHDFLWRVNDKVPQKGMIHLFNRSHYEEVLVTKVHPEYILGQNIPHLNNVEDINSEFWNERYHAIRSFEKNLTQSGTVIIKFFLNVSREEQKDRLLDRMNEPDKNWKFNIGDVHERQLWPKYMQAYQEAINQTATENAPWFVIP
ncbi:MAG: PPK2 family polyphosphate kinase, partial [Flavobacteriales bacterium]